MKSTLTIPPKMTGSIRFESDFCPVEKNDINSNQIIQGATIVDQFVLVSFDAPLIMKWYVTNPKPAGIKNSGYQSIDAANIFKKSI